MNNKNSIIYIYILLSIISFSCRKLIEIDAPVNKKSRETVYSKDYSAIATVTAIYSKMAAGNYDDDITSLSFFPSLCADELELFNLTKPAELAYYRNELRAIGIGLNRSPGYWNWSYQYIYQVNASIEGIGQSEGLTPAVKNHLLGEALFLRAFFYFYLVNLYGDVPLILTTDYRVNATQPRESKGNVYNQIITDLKTAQNLLSDDYLDVTLLNTANDRIRPNKWSATALLARVYLYNSDFSNAETQASLLIENNPAYKLVTPKEVFLKNSYETIWALQPVKLTRNTWEAVTFTLPAEGPNIYNFVYLPNRLISIFQNEDLRLKDWINSVTANGIDYYYASKYKTGTNSSTIEEYTMVLRLAEQYLIRAEARAQQGKLTGTNSAVSDLDTIRNRAGLLPVSFTEKEEILNAILEERQREFFTEWGHRWFDLKRTGKIDAVMNIVCPQKGGTWESYKALFPIPQSEIDGNYSLEGKQNPGYTN